MHKVQASQRLNGKSTNCNKQDLTSVETSGSNFSVC